MSLIDFIGLRVFIDENKHDIYLSLRSPSPHKAIGAPFVTMKDLFIFAACMGAKSNYYKQVKNRRDIFSGELFNAKSDVPILASLAYHKTNDIDVLSNPKEVLDINQCWANGGIEVVNEKLLGQTGLPLLNFVDMILGEFKTQ